MRAIRLNSIYGGILPLILLLALLLPLSSPVSYAAITIDVWTDSPVYNPDELVTITGYVEVDGSPAAGTLVLVTIKDPTGNVVLTRYLVTNSTGNFELLFNVSTAIYTDVYGVWSVIAQISGGPSDSEIFIVGTPVLEITSPAADSTFEVNDTVTISGSFYVSENSQGIPNTSITVEVSNGTSTVFSDTVITDSNGSFSTSFTITSDMASTDTTFTITVTGTLTGTSSSVNINVVVPTGGAPGPLPGAGLVGGVLVPESPSGIGLLALIPVAVAGVIAALLYKLRRK
ncbi:MAG: Ig-like domain-containing protein [Desulfurococcales archaeon]|nr:Ig-like domain-containing protein [Desulfurococcales archaeon]MCE4605673.1 Ig-like domain-containing protein [Desulfurococcales archaeon]